MRSRINGLRNVATWGPPSRYCNDFQHLGHRHAIARLVLGLPVIRWRDGCMMIRISINCTYPGYFVRL
jgi:hypothetical protein